MPKFYAALIYPSNIVCDALHVSGESERGVIRMLVNALICTTLGVLVVWAVS